MQVLKYVEDESAKEEEPRGELDHLVTKLWRRLLLLPSDPVWYSCNLILSYFSVLGNILLSVNGKCVTAHKSYNFIVIFYVLDGIFLVDSVLQSLSMIFVTSSPSSVKLAKRPIPVMVTEFMSVLPIEQTVGYSHPKLFCALRLNRSLRMVVICYYNTKRNWQISSTWLSKLVEFVSILLFLVLITFGIYCNIQCFMTNECADQFCDGEDYLAAITSAVTCMGFLNLPQDNYFQILCIMVQMFVFYFVCSTAIARCTVAHVSHYSNQIGYSSCCLAMISSLKRRKAPKYLIARVNEEFHLIWSRKRNKCYNLIYEGFGTGQSFLHPSMYNELQIDITWTAFKHSHLFRDMHFHYLRYLADFVKLEYKLPGEYLYLKGQWKDKMIYISSGTIEILSNEDEQSSILSLCEGTCIGESCLIIWHKSSHYIRCKTFCEFHVLEKADFLRSYKLFKEDYIETCEIIFDRYRETEVLHEMSTQAKSSLSRVRGNVDSYTLLWIKNTLHRLMAKDADSTFRHEFQNIYLINEVKASEFKKLLFHAEYLDMLVVRERLEVDVDSVFVRVKFPFIFQPNSVVCILWTIIIIILTVVLAVVIPILSFLTVDIPEWYFWLVTVVTHMFVVDVLLQLSTAVKGRHGLTLNLISTAKARLQTMGIWADIAACVPTEMFLCIVTTSPLPQYSCQAQLNRLLKMWKIKYMMDMWDEEFNANKLVIRYVKYTFTLLYLTFICFCLLGYFIPVNDYTALLFEAVQMITATNIYGVYSPPDLFTTLSNFICIIVVIMLYASIMAGFIMVSLPRFQTQDMCTSVFKLLKTNRILHKYEERILAIIKVEWFENKCNRLKMDEEVMCEISKKSFQDSMMDNVGNILKSVRLFQTLSDDFIYDLCGIVTPQIIPPNEAILYNGDVTPMVSIIYEGTFNVFGENGMLVASVNTPTTINLMEAYLKIPSVQTRVTVSHCRSLSFNVKHMKSILNKYASATMDLEHVLHNCADIKAALHNQVSPNEYYPDLSKASIQKNLFTFPWRLPEGSFAEYDYHIPFDRLYPFSFIRFLLMRFTINPEGSFLYYWELTRCICAILTGILFYFIPLITSPFRDYLLLLDMMALADIYIRLHVAYFLENGVMVWHPLLTAKYYLKGAFIIDIIGMIPTGSLLSPNSSTWMIVLHSNKLLQMYRFMAFFMVYYRERITLAQKSYGLTFIPSVLVVSCYAAQFILLYECNFDDTAASFAVGSLVCSENSIFAVLNFSTTPNPMVAQAFAIYVATAIVTNTGIQGFIISDDIRLLVIALTLIGITIAVSYSGKFVTLYSFTHTSFLKFHDAMTSLTMYMSNLKVKQNLQKQVIDNYEIKFGILKGRSTHKLLGRFSTSLQYDVLYDLYGKQLYRTSVFTQKKKSFYRNLLPLMKYDIVVKGGYIGKVNDITSDMHILYNGYINAISYDSMKVDTLGPGSMFGNMENKEMARLFITFEAISHVEFLTLSAKEFHGILNFYPDLENEFSYLRSEHLRYICKFNKLSLESGVDKIIKPVNKGAFKPNTKGMMFWETIVLLYPAYFGIILDAYQSAVLECSYYFLSFLYLGDVIYMLHYIVKERTSYIDKSGALVDDLTLVRKRFRRNKFMLVMRIISIVPIDLPVLLLNMEESVKFLIYGIARWNRFCRLSHFFEYFSHNNYKMKNNVYLTRIVFLLLWCFLALNALATGILFIASFKFQEYTNIHPHVPCFSAKYNMTSLEKFDLYVTYLQLSANIMNFTSQPNIYPLAFLEICLFVSIMLIAQHLMYLCFSQMYSLTYQCLQSRLTYRDTLNRLNHFMTREDVSAALFDRILSYVKRRWLKNGNDVYPFLMDEAPVYMQEKILTSVFGYLINKHHIFSGCRRDFLRQVIQKIRSRTYFHGDYIQFEGVIDKCMYFIYNGEVTAYKEERYVDVVHTVLKAGDSFGVLQGLQDAKKHEYTYKATKQSILVILNYQMWEHLLKFFPNDSLIIANATKEFIKNN